MKKGSKKFNLEKFVEKKFKDSLEYIWDSRSFIYSIVGVFFFFSLIGFFVPLSEAFSAQILEHLRELVGRTRGLGTIEMILFLFNNNSLSSLMGLFLGFFFGLFPIFNAILNGFVLGFVAELSVSEYGILSLWRILPHGIIELPAIFISLGLGLKFSTFIFKKEKFKAFEKFFINSFFSYLFVVLPLLVIAAIIEGVLITLGN